MKSLLLAAAALLALTATAHAQTPALPDPNRMSRSALAAEVTALRPPRKSPCGLLFMWTSRVTRWRSPLIHRK